MSSGKIRDASDPKAILEAASIIRNGGLVAFPTETVYGLGADACDPIAVARVFEVKGRPRLDPIIVHVADALEAGRYGRLPEAAGMLMRRFWPGPLTLVVPKSDLIPPIVTAGLETVAIRMPGHPAALALLSAAGRALAAPSANLFGYVSPTEARHVAEQIGDGVDLILDGGRCIVGVESTVLALTGAVPRILRVGGIPPEDLEHVLGKIEWSTGVHSRPEAPGQMSRHYATCTPLEIMEEGDPGVRPAPNERVGIVALTEPENADRYAAVEVLSPSGSLREAAANLFAALYRLDRLQLDRLVALAVPERGLGLAIMDRLRRCAAKKGQA